MLMIVIYHSSHWRKIPHIANNAPRGQHSPQILLTGLLQSVPVRIRQSIVVLHRDRVDCRADLMIIVLSFLSMRKLPYFERSLLEHHNRCVVDASSFGKYDYWQLLLVFNVFAKSLRYFPSIGGFTSLEPNMTL